MFIDINPALPEYKHVKRIFPSMLMQMIDRLQLNCSLLKVITERVNQTPALRDERLPANKVD